MLTVAVLSLKGGVGKSTVVLGLSSAAAHRGLRCLVVDLDPQANATVGLDPPPFAFSSSDVLADARPAVAADALVPSGWGEAVMLLPSERALEHRNIPAGRDSALRLRLSLQGVTDGFDLTLIDCPPALGELTRNALAAASLALVVTEPGYFALQATAQALEAVDVVRRTTNLGLRVAGIVVNRVRARNAEHAYRLNELTQAYPDIVLQPTIPDRSAVQQAQGAGRPLHGWRSPGGREAAAVFDQLLDQLSSPRTNPRR